MKPSCIAELPDSPLDIIGDIHGEIDALRALLERLGYDDRGRHPDDRKLVFVGDLIDRGPDSPAVLRTVMPMVEAGNAQCIAGNHELNAIRDDSEKHRAGEGWWYGRTEPDCDSVLVDPDEKERSFLPFLRSLPCALEREGLRVVHACWHEPSIEKLRRAHSLIEAFDREVAALEPDLAELEAEFFAVRNELSLPAALRDKSTKLDFIPELARLDEAKQMGNAVKVVTSGIERAAPDSYWASGKWRMVERVLWWEEYSGPPVVVGHYWRRYFSDRPAIDRKTEADVFGDLPPEVALGPERNVMCIDYSVGIRSTERNAGVRDRSDQFNGCLAALRIPEWELVFDDGRPGLRVEVG